MTTEYWPAPQVKAYADALIPEHHPHLAQLDVRMIYLFRTPTEEKRGHLVLGKARKIGGLHAYLASADEDGTLVHGEVGPEDEDVAPALFVIEIAFEPWGQMTERQRRALVDHELAHCMAYVNTKGDVVLGTVPHDLEDFVAVARRNGLWHPTGADYVRAVVEAEQLTLDLAQGITATGEVATTKAELADKVTPIRKGRKK